MSALKQLDLEEFTEQLNQARSNGHGNGHGVKKTGPSLSKWVPKKWTPVFTEIVLLSCAGFKNIELAKKYNYTEVHISNILRTPQAALLRRAVLEELQDRASKSIPEKLEQIALKTVDRLHTILNDDELFKNSPFGVIDRGLKVLAGTGHIRSENSHNVGGTHIRAKNAIILTQKDSNDLLQGLERAKQAKMLNSGDDFESFEGHKEDEKVQEGEFTVMNPHETLP